VGALVDRVCRGNGACHPVFPPQLSGYTALMTATEYGREDMVRSLLQAGADKAIQNKVGTPLAALVEPVPHWLGMGCMGPGHARGV
jgi:hypothetical protein